MPQICTFMLCDSINSITPQPDVNIPQLSGPLNALRPKYIPGVFSFGLAVGVSGLDLQKAQILQLLIFDPDGEIVHDTGANTLPPLPNADSSLPEEFRGFTLTMDIRNLEIKKSGVYSLELRVDDNCVGQRDIPVFEAARL